MENKWLICHRLERDYLVIKMTITYNGIHGVPEDEAVTEMITAAGTAHTMLPFLNMDIGTELW